MALGTRGDLGGVEGPALEGHACLARLGGPVLDLGGHVEVRRGDAAHVFVADADGELAIGAIGQHQA
eukprot:6706406-Lingulodinium_polyedra.AAC.1